MTEPTHTPLPWEAQVLETENDPGVYIVGSNLGGLVCAALPWPTEIDAGEYSRVEANAALIVQAVNSHHRLVEALEDIVNPLGKLRRDAEAEGRQLSNMAYSIANDLSFVKSIARAALKEAGR